MSVKYNVPILIVVPLSKYMPKVFPILQELNQYGHIESMIDVIGYVDYEENPTRLKIVKDTKKCGY